MPIGRGNPKPGAPRSLEIQGLDQEGRGVAFDQGRPVLVRGALPGEMVCCHTIARKRNHDEAVIRTIATESPQRVEPRCRHFGHCGGCSLQHLEADSQVELKQHWLLDCLRRIGSVEPGRVLPPLRGPVWEYRRKARLAVQWDSRTHRAIVGFRASDSTTVADVRRCEVLHGEVAEVMAPLSDLIRRLSIRRQVPQVEVAVGDEGQVLCFRVLAAPSPADIEAFAEFSDRHGARVLLEANNGELSSIPGRATPVLHYSLPAFALRLAFLSTHFVQINDELNQAMVDHALRLLDPAGDENLLDLFCGLGNFTLPLATRARSVLGIDGDPALVTWAGRNATANGLDNVAFKAVDLGADLSHADWLQRRYDAVLLDPPRTGALELMPHFGRLGIPRILYVSCDPRTLSRDVGFLVREHRYQLVAAGILDMFPHTSHVESMVLLRRPSVSAG